MSKIGLSCAATLCRGVLMTTRNSQARPPRLFLVSWRSRTSLVRREWWQRGQVRWQKQNTIPYLCLLSARTPPQATLTRDRSILAQQESMRKLVLPRIHNTTAGRRSPQTQPQDTHAIQKHLTSFPHPNPLNKPRHTTSKLPIQFGTLTSTKNITTQTIRGLV